MMHLLFWEALYLPNFKMLQSFMIENGSFVLGSMETILRVRLLVGAKLSLGKADLKNKCNHLV